MAAGWYPPPHLASPFPRGRPPEARALRPRPRAFSYFTASPPSLDPCTRLTNTARAHIHTQGLGVMLLPLSWPVLSWRACPCMLPGG